MVSPAQDPFPRACLELIDCPERYQKSNQLGGLRWSEEAAGVLPGGVTGRVCRVSIVESLAHESGHIDHFPAVGYGLNDDGSEPHFTSKKAAKHFAAKCAVEWLSTHGLIASHLYGPSLFLKPSSHLPIAPAPSLKRAPQSTSSSTSSTSTPSPPKRQTMTSPQGLDGTLDATTTLTLSSPATELVATLCCELNISAPKYVLVEIAPNSKVFNGRAIFDDYGDSEILSLAEASVVQGVEGKDAAKKAIAAKVLARLREIEVARDAQLQLMIAQRMKDI